MNLTELKMLAQDLRNERTDFQRKADYAQECLNEIQRKMAMMKLEASMDTPMAEMMGGWAPTTNKTIKKTMIIINLKRSMWECYVDTPDGVIETINGYFGYVIANNTNPVDVQREIFKLMGMYSEWGFYDSECLQVATDTINNCFNSNLDRWECIKETWAASWASGTRSRTEPQNRVY